MKFTCDSCRSQYMISDEKVGPNGVKVRCKKCGNVVLVRRAQEVAAAMAAPAPAPASAPAPAPSPGGSGDGLDVELGQAFDNAFGDAPKKEEPPPDLGATQAMTPEDAAKIAAPGAAPAAPAPEPAATEWYVAIGEAQVGPLPLSEVKKKWETGDVGPDSLVWRPGMDDWAPLTTVRDLAGYLAPVPQPVRTRSAPEVRSETPAQTPAPREEPTWKPAGASALAALASEEIAARSVPIETRPAARPAGGRAPSLVESMNLPDAGGVDPTGAIPLPIKGLEPSIERKLTTVARGAKEIRHRRSATRAVLYSVLATLVVLGAGGFALVTWLNGRLASSQLLAARPAAAPGPRPQQPAAAPPPAAAAAPAAAAPPAAPAAAAPAPAAAAQHAPAEPAKAPPPRAEPERHEVARSEPAHRAAAKEPEREPPAKRTHEAAKAKREHEKEPPRVAAREEPPPPAPAPAPAPKKKSDLLDFDGGGGGGDAALDEALGKAPSGRSVYVPPKAAAGGGDLPAQLTDSQIQGAVLGNLDALRKCVADQKARDAEATGTLQMRWIIVGDGNTRDVKCVTPEYATSPFAQCIGSILRATRFPRSATKGQTVTMPFKF
jgi:predicted Zn finger-like uncharacterized protein